MTGLRAALIEAVEDEVTAWFGPDDDDDPIASDILDAVLDVLADRADEWMVQAMNAAYGDVRAHYRLDADDLIAVLRGDT